MFTEILGKRNHEGSYIVRGVEMGLQPPMLEELIEEGGVFYVKVRSKAHLNAMTGDQRRAYDHKIGEYMDHGKVRVALQRTWDPHAGTRLVTKLVEIGDEPVPVPVKYAVHLLNPEGLGCMLEEVETEATSAVISVAPPADAPPPKPKRKKPVARRKRATTPKTKE